MGRGENDEVVSLMSVDGQASEAAGPPEEKESDECQLSERRTSNENYKDVRMFC